jgi:phospholipid-binding lipoprotein MlaA
MLKRFTLILTILSFTLLSGCATTGAVDQRDPIEGLNRAIYKFNDGVDRAILKPIAKGYQTVMPAPADRGVSNFFGNLEDVVTTINDLLQFKFERSGKDAMRVLLNSTIGLLGLFDVASTIDGLEKHNEDFGQTLGYWGVGAGPYLMLPIFGPSTLRDVTGRVVDTAVFDPIYYIDHIPTRNSLIGVNVVDKRADLLGASKVLEEAALDRYDFIKESYFQQREDAINDGELIFTEYPDY